MIIFPFLNLVYFIIFTLLLTIINYPKQNATSLSFYKKTLQGKKAKDLIEAFFYLDDYFSFSTHKDNLDNHMYHILLDVMKLYPEMKNTFSEALFAKLPDMVETLKNAQKNKEIRKDYDPEALAMLIIYSVEGLVFVSALTGDESNLVKKSRFIGENLWMSIKT